VYVTTTDPEVAPIAGSDFFVADPPVAVTATDLYPPGTVTGKVMSAGVPTCTFVSEGAVMVGASGVPLSSSSHAQNEVIRAAKVIIDKNFFMINNWF
jgi:hypothetical protein